MAIVKIEVPDFDGWEFSRIGHVDYGSGEKMLIGNELHTPGHDDPVDDDEYLILYRKCKYRNATMEDAIRALRGEAVNCRFRNNRESTWSEGKLRTCLPMNFSQWICEMGNERVFEAAYCEVLDEQSLIDSPRIN